MATISSGITGDSNVFNLKEISTKEIRSEIHGFLVPGENIIQACELPAT